MAKTIDYLQLSTAERILLAQDILGSVLAGADAEILTPEQRAEVGRRVADIRAERVTCLSWDQVRDQFLAGR